MMAVAANLPAKNVFWGIGFWLIVVSSAIPASDGVNERLNLWPMPKSVSHGHHSLYLSNGFELKTNGSPYLDGSGILKDGLSRILEVIRGSHVVDGKVAGFNQSRVLKGIHVVVLSPSDELQHGVNESYHLTVPDHGSLLYAYLRAQTVYGALHGLQTFSQMCQFDFTSRAIEVRQVPWNIFDQPRFPYRGLLIDTARHYLPLPVIKKVIDSMTYTKLNVLHWHIVDTQSFPLEIPSFPKLWDGAYSSSERYTVGDATEIVRYAQRRGINVLAELDVPGHAQSWGVGYPKLWPSKDCQQPLDVSSQFTFKVINGILSDFSKIFKYKFVHLGGDEVNTSCWTSTPRINKWLKKRHFDGQRAYESFVLQAQKIALSLGYEIINWEETFNNFPNRLSRKTVIHNWIGGGVCHEVVGAGLRCIVSNQNQWYLDHLDVSWEEFYMNEPLEDITDPKQQALVLGGEVCMWGENIDASDIEQTIWPRAAAAAERLWSSSENLPEDPGSDVAARLAHFRCLLNQRGVAAAPLLGEGRDPPQLPGSCQSQ